MAADLLQTVVVAARRGEVIIFPTESSYAIGCRVDSRRGLAEVKRRKGRQDSRFTVVASSLYQVERHFNLTREQKRLAQQYWPGPVSIVVSSRFAIRVPANLLMRQLVRAAGAPLVASSLNQSGEPAIFSLNHLSKQFRDLPQLNLGRLRQAKPSTVVGFKGKKMIVYRHGAVKL